MPRRRRAEALGEVRQPLRDRRRLVVDDVVDARLAALDRERRRRGRVVGVEERPDPGAVADERQLPRADELRVLVRHRRAGAVQAAVAEDEPLDRRRGDDPPLEVADRLDRPRAAARAGSRSSGSLSVFTGPPTRSFGQPA